MHKFLMISVLLFVGLNPASAHDLLEIYDLAWQNDPTLHEFEENKNAALEAKPQSLAKLLPTLGIVGNLNGNRFNTDNTFTNLQLGTQYFWDSNVFLKLSQPVYHHDYWIQLSQSENQIAQAEAEYEAEQQNFFIRTAKAYFGVLAAQSNLQFASAEKQSLEFQLKQAKKRFEVGTASITDIREAQAGFDQSKASEIDAEKKLREAKSILTEIIGLFDVELNPLRDDVPLELPIPSNLDDWIGLARQNNWTIIAASNRAEALRKNVEIQFSGHLPTLDFVGNFGVSDTDRPAGMVSNSQTIGLQLNVPIFQGGGVESRIRQAEHQLAGAKQNVDKQRRAAERQAQDAYQGIELSISQIEVLKSAVESTKVALNAAEKGLSVGTRTMADVLTVTRNLSRAQRDHAQARYDYILSGLTLKQATGSISRTDLEVVNKWLH
jgi:outer membrane protein